MSDYFRQNCNVSSFDGSGWTILSSVEQQIKEKIERKGIPLKEWDIKIYRGILTGFNDAFIIDSDTRNKLIKASPKSDKIIRPILRGRDIQKYKAEWDGNYLIVTHNGYTNTKGKYVDPININDYPAIKNHLDGYWEKIEERIDKGVTPYNLRSCIYMEDFFRPKIMYPNMTKFMPFIFDEQGYFINDKGFIITGDCIAFLTAFFNSSIFKFCFRENFPELQGGTRELRKVFFDKIPVIKVSEEQNKEFERRILKVQKLKAQGIETKDIEKEIDEMMFNLYELSPDERKTIGFIEIT